MFTVAANRRYTIQTASCWALFLMLTTLLPLVGATQPGSASALLLSATIALPIILHVIATLELIRNGDEFARALTAKRFVIAWGIAMALWCAWGFAEQIAALRHAPGWMLYPLFWLSFGVVALFVRSSR